MKSNWSKHKPTMFPPSAFYLMALVALVIVFIMEDLGSKIADVFRVEDSEVAAVASEPTEIKAGQTWVYYSCDPFSKMPYQTNYVIAVSNGYVKYKNCYGDENVSTEWFFQIDSTLKEVK